MTSIRKFILIAVVAALAGGVGLFVWARSVLTGDAVRNAVASQLSTSIGQPVTIGTLGATIFPRVTMTLHDVRIGEPARITARELFIGTDLGALLSRRIEHAVVRLAGARVTLPLPAMAASASSDTTSSKPPVEIVSVDEVSFTDVEIVSGARTLKGAVDLALRGSAVEIRRATLTADKTSFSLSGTITDLAGPVGELAVTASGLDVAALVAFANDFAASAGLGDHGVAHSTPASSSGHAAPSTPMNVVVALSSDKATFGDLTLDKLSGRARFTGDALQLEPIAFGVFGGRYDGVATFSLAQAATVHLKATLASVDMAALMTFAGKPGAVTGKLSGTIDVSARGAVPADIVNSARGTARVDITQGAIKGLGLVRGVIMATSMRAGGAGQASGASSTEPFARLGATLAIASGTMTTNDLHFESTDVLLSATGTVKLDGSSVRMAGPVQLSDQLSAQAGRDLVKYTQKDGRVTVPAEVSGPVDQLAVRIDVGDLAKRAITNAAKDDLLKALQKKIGRGGGRP